MLIYKIKYCIQSFLKTQGNKMYLAFFLSKKNSLSVFTHYTISKYNMVWLTGGGSHPMAAPKNVPIYIIIRSELYLIGNIYLI